MKEHPADLIKKLDEQDGEGSKSRQRSLIEDYFNDPSDTRPVQEREFYKVVQYALDPWKNFFIQTVPGLNDVNAKAKRVDRERKGGHKDIFDVAPKRLSWKEQFATMFELLDKLRTRKISPNSADARHAVLEWANSVGPGTIFCFRKILQKNLQIGMKAASFNKIIPGWVPEFRLSLAKPFNTEKLQFPCWVDPKYDGERCLAFITIDGNTGSVSYLSRQGNEFQNLRSFTDDLIQIFHAEGNVVVDCEVVNRQGFQSLQKMPVHFDPNFDAANLELVVFDLIPQKEFNSQDYPVSQSDRYGMLRKIFKGNSSQKISLIDSRIAKDFDEAQDLFEYWVGLGLEGVIMKQRDTHYHFSTTSTRNPGWIKMKPRFTHEFKVVGIEPGRSGHRWEGKCGSLIVERIDPEKGSVLVGVGGLTDHMHENIIEVNGQIQYTNPDGEVVDLRGQLVEVAYDAVTDDGNLRFPAVKRRGHKLIRTDI